MSVTLPGDFSTLNFSESPNDAVECFLLRILEPPEDVPDDAYLSEKCCTGILRRGSKRKQGLPEALEIALRLQAGLDV